ncbi:hypothetical protein PRK78_006353 [Emydomyces testavorans]|uniref:Uncharacterized protein n=1 Tax=Emydomyces testavorans TaxID=2070801 RepID=A0AAF0IKE3_9EURO|nr:hypothetical protein PRK78_006353 [Emydomyces testavorans]
MGVDTRRPILPAPTDSSFLDTSGTGTGTGTDLATDISRRTDKTSYSIPDDGSPITISTRRKSQPRDREESKVSRSGHNSHTSLLIEYFEGGKKASGLNPRPSVRVRVTPSSSRKNRNRDDHVHITESASGRKPSYTRRISLGTPSRTKELTEEAADESSTTSGAEETPTARRPPVEIEFVDQSSAVSSRYIQPTSEISSMPPDSLLDSTMGASQTQRHRRQSFSDEERIEQDDNLLKTPSRRRSRSLSRERIAQKAAEKLSSTPKDHISRSKQRYSERSGSRDVGKDVFDSDIKSSRKRSGKHREKDLVSPESSLLSNSALSHSKGGDQYSFRSGTSRSSLNNPKLLETVEDAIRRLILPELKELKKDQKVQSNRAKFERDTSTSRVSGSVGSKDDLVRRLSKHSSAPDVSKSRVTVSKSEPKSPLSPSNELSSRRERRREKQRSPRHERRGSRLSGRLAPEEPGVHRKKSKGLRDAEAAKIVGTALTAAALKHHDSTSSFGSKRERKKRRSGSESINETELIFEKHDVPPMPHLRSELESQVTRQSILSQQSDNTVDPLHGEVTRGSPREIGSPVARDLNVTPRPSNKSLKSSRSNLSNPPLHIDGVEEETIHKHDKTSSPNVPHINVDTSYTPGKDIGHNGEYFNRRALSPIQSVASYQEGRGENEEAIIQQGHLSHVGHRMSIDSLSSAPSTDLARSTRNTDHSSERRRAISDQQNESGVDLGYGASSRHSHSDGHWEESQHEEFDEHRRSLLGESEAGSSVDAKRMTNYTDEHFDDPLDPGQKVAKGNAANPEFVHTPIGVESAVASLLEPSVIGSNHSPVTESLSRPRSWGSGPMRELTHDVTVSRKGSPLKQQVHASSGHADTSFQKRMGVSSPPQSVANSTDEDDKPYMGATGIPTAGSPIPEIGHIQDSEESEINTNPSIIQGPIGGLSYDDRDHWPFNSPLQGLKGTMLTEPNQYNGTLEPSPLLVDKTGPTGLGVINEEHAAPSQRHYQQPDTYPNGRVDVISPGGGKDEGYISGANHRSASTVTPEPKGKGLAGLEDIPFSSPLDDGDPFTHKRHLSGYSHGIESPLYDSATGHGIDRIQSKDIVALMDHLTVRDAQRNARDTEILVTLVRSAAEMRNSFEDMKKFIATQDEKLMDTTEKHHDQTQRILSGPRPQPASLSRTPRRMSEDDDDTPTKKKNVFRRALKGLSLKSSNDLTHIEDMLVHLLTEVEALRATQENHLRGTSLTENHNSLDNPRGSLDGFAPQSQPASGLVNQSGRFANSPHSTGDLKQLSAQREAERRISPVMEDNEGPLTPREEDLVDPQMTDAHFLGRHKRGDSVPLTTPDRPTFASGALSTETTPKMSTEKSRKHKSSSSSFFPKISRWSKTTASSMGENLKNSIQSSRKERPYSEMSRSGSDLNLGEYATNDYYDHRGDDRLRSNASLDREHRQENRPPSPLVPSQVSEHPKYRAHRDSLNLQHPQPRPGARYQTHLESQAHNFAHMDSPASEPWASTHSLGEGYQHQTQSNTGRRSPFSDGGLSTSSSIAGRQNAPPRPPKIRDEGPLVPQRPASIKDGSQPTYVERIALREGGNSGNPEGKLGSPKGSPGRTGPQRRPTGPRPNPSAGKYGGGQFPNVKRHQYRGSPNQIDDEDDGY